MSDVSELSVSELIQLLYRVTGALKARDFPIPAGDFEMLC